MRVGDLTGVTAVSPGRTTCALADGGMYCWGDNEHGQVGDGTRTTRTEPVHVGLTGVTSFATAPTWNCAIAAERLRCWGANEYGQLGDGTTEDRDRPTPVRGLGAVTAVSASGTATEEVTCALSGGVPYCWGSSSSGQIGDGGSTLDDRLTPARVKDLTGVSSLVTGWGTICAVAGGAPQCWGSNGSGAVGDGTTEHRRTPARVGELTGVTSMTTANGTTCALADRKAYCWRMGEEGQIGAGRFGNSQAPEQVKGLSGVTAIVTDALRTCAIADAAVYCWGLNSSLGIGSDERYVDAPRRIVAPATS